MNHFLLHILLAKSSAAFSESQLNESINIPFASISRKKLNPYPHITYYWIGLTYYLLFDWTYKWTYIWYNQWNSSSRAGSRDSNINFQDSPERGKWLIWFFGFKTNGVYKKPEGWYPWGNFESQAYFLADQLRHISWWINCRRNGFPHNDNMLFRKSYGVWGSML